MLRTRYLTACHMTDCCSSDDVEDAGFALHVPSLWSGPLIATIALRSLLLTASKDLSVLPDSSTKGSEKRQIMNHPQSGPISILHP